MADFHVVAGSDGTLIHPTVRQIGPHDLKEALRKGVEDFKAMPTHLAFIGLIYPLFGIGLAALTFTENALPLLFPLVSGFALLGPISAIGLYELSRRRELGLDTSWDHLFDVLRSPSLPSILALAGLLLVIFVVWLATAQALYQWLYGPLAPQSYTGFLAEVLTTSRGWTLIILGHALGLHLRGRGVHRRRDLVSVAARSRLRRRLRGADLGQGRPGQPAHDGALGGHHRRPPDDRLSAAPRRPRGRHADPRACELASLPAHGGAGRGRQSAAALRRRLTRRSGLSPAASPGMTSGASCGYLTSRRRRRARASAACSSTRRS